MLDHQQVIPIFRECSPTNYYLTMCNFLDKKVVHDKFWKDLPNQSPGKRLRLQETNTATAVTYFRVGWFFRIPPNQCFDYLWFEVLKNLPLLLGEDDPYFFHCGQYEGNFKGPPCPQNQELGLLLGQLPLIAFIVEGSCTIQLTIRDDFVQDTEVRYV